MREPVPTLSNLSRMAVMSSRCTRKCRRSGLRQWPCRNVLCCDGFVRRLRAGHSESAPQTRQPQPGGVRYAQRKRIGFIRDFDALAFAQAVILFMYLGVLKGFLPDLLAERWQRATERHAQVKSLISMFNRMRRKRHDTIYAVNAFISRGDAEQALATAGKYLAIIRKEIQKSNPQKKLL